MKQTDKSADGTSFHNHTFTATVDDLRNVLGQPKFESNDGQDKVNFGADTEKALLEIREALMAYTL